MGIFGMGGGARPVTPEQSAYLQRYPRQPGESFIAYMKRTGPLAKSEAAAEQAADKVAAITPVAPPSVAETASSAQVTARDKAALARRRAAGGNLLLAGQPGGAGRNAGATLAPATLVGSS